MRFEVPSTERALVQFGLLGVAHQVHIATGVAVEVWTWELGDRIVIEGAGLVPENASIIEKIVGAAPIVAFPSSREMSFEDTFIPVLPARGFLRFIPSRLRRLFN